MIQLVNYKSKITFFVQIASGFGGGFSGLGGKPIEPNRNPFEVNPSLQSSGWLLLKIIVPFV
jgi:hypothetical protein